MDVVTSLVKAIFRENPYDLLIENWKALEFAVQSLGSKNQLLDIDFPAKALEAVLDCTKQTGACPRNIASVVAFIHKNVHHNQNYEKSEGYTQQLRDIEDDEEEDNINAAVLVDAVYHQAYNFRYADIHLIASKIATDSMKNEHTKESGPQAAKEYIQEEESRLYVKGTKSVHGDLRDPDNLQYIEDLINSYMLSDSTRLFTGFKNIDNVTLIGRKQNIRYIGILGYTHHGKSLFLNTMVYNMACQGANVFLCPREQSIDMTYMTLVWLHYKKVCPERKMVSLADWQRLGEHVGKEAWDTIRFILKDLREGNTLPGRLVVEPCKSWDEIEETLRITNKKYNYDVLAVDYLAHLDTTGSKKESDFEKQKQTFRKAQMLSLDGIENDKSGLVVITPLQANKKGRDEAADQEGDKYGVYESLGAVDYFTQAAQDMDCVIGLWYEGEKCLDVKPPQMIVHCMKGRGNMIFPKHYVALHPESGLLYDIDGADIKLDPERTAGDLSNMDVAESLYTTTTTTTIDTENWGM